VRDRNKENSIEKTRIMGKENSLRNLPKIDWVLLIPMKKRRSQKRIQRVHHKCPI
jgi:hypothetical protein